MWTPDEIYTSKGQVIHVSPEDWRNLAQHCWSIGAAGYVQRNVYLPSGKRTTSMMHREIFGCTPGDGLQVDHWNHNPLDNRRRNLRQATQLQNMYNLTANPNGTSRYRGVSWCRRTGKWAAKIRSNGRGKTLGYFDVEEDARNAYEAAAKVLHGEFAYATSSAIGEHQ